MSTLKECIITTFFPYNKIITVDSTTYKNIINNELNVFNNECYKKTQTYKVFNQK